MKKYLVAVEATAAGFSACSTDLPGCIATGVTRDEVEHEMGAASQFRIEGTREEGQIVPEPHSYPAFFEVAA